MTVFLLVVKSTRATRSLESNVINEHNWIMKEFSIDDHLAQQLEQECRERNKFIPLNIFESRVAVVIKMKLRSTKIN